MVMAFVAFLAVLALATFWLLGQAQNAEDDLEAQRQTNTRLQAEIAQLDGARLLRRNYELGVGRLQVALANDVAWGRLFNDLARIINQRAWLGSLSATASLPTELDVSVGSMTLTGTAFWYEDASSWLRVLDSSYWPAVGAGWVSSTSVGEVEEAKSILLCPAVACRVR